MTRAELIEIVEHYRQAEIAVLQGKSITFNGQTMTMENLSAIQAGLEKYERRLGALTSDGERRRGTGAKLARFR